jgi:hypothetical protein
MESDLVEAELKNLVGRPAWGLNRTLGSTFFLEIGARLARGERKRVHGEWHFLIEMCHWKFAADDRIIVGSDDEQALIDDTFSRTSLGTVSSASAMMPSRELNIAFDSGIILRTFLASTASSDEATHWFLFLPDGNVLQAKTAGTVVKKSRYQP